MARNDWVQNGAIMAGHCWLAQRHRATEGQRVFSPYYRSTRKERLKMAVMKKVTPAKVFMGKISYGADLLEELTEVCRRENVHLGRIEALGAVQRARLGFYNQQMCAYQFVELNQPLEITMLVGNVSVKDRKPMVHAHVTLADETGKAFGGHLAPGTIVFACEFILQAYEGPAFERGHDEQTGLPLWTM
jgi:predicted DNA-binding protein with PD1-like motif